MRETSSFHKDQQRRRFRQGYLFPVAEIESKKPESFHKRNYVVPRSFILSDRTLAFEEADLW